MAAIAQGMLRQALDAFVREDAELALQVCHQDDAVDQLADQVLRELLTFMMEDPHTISRALRLSFVSKYIERVADHAVNISEMVVFMVKGKSIRHLDRPPSTL
jgi:phosphate transport system protein